MELKLLKTTQDILVMAEMVSGKGFEFVHEPGLLAAYAGVKAARKSMPKHIIYYKGIYDGIDHDIAHECAHVIRIFNVSEKDRKIPISSKENMEYAFKVMQDDILRLTQGVPDRDIGRFWKLWYNGTVSWLTNMGVDARIEKWIYEFEELRKSHEVAIDKLMYESAFVLNKRYKEITPKKIYDVLVPLNYCFAICLDSIMGKDYSGVYDKLAYELFGRTAIKLVNIALDEKIGDKDCIDRCAGVLGMEGWFEWTDFENIPPDYVSRGMGHMI